MKTSPNKNTKKIVLYASIILLLIIGFFIIHNNTKTNIDLNGLWKNSENTSIMKITQEGNNVTFALYQQDPNWQWPGNVGDITVKATLSDGKLVGEIMTVPEKGYCSGYSWWHNYTATISKGGMTINQVFETNGYDNKTCRQTGELSQKTKSLTRIVN